MKAHERIKIALISLFITFSIIAWIIYLIYDYAKSDVILFLAVVFLVSTGVVVYHIIEIVKDWRNAKNEISEWTKENPKESAIMGFASFVAGLVILIFFLWPYVVSGFSQSSPRDIKALLFGIIGAAIFFIIGRFLLKAKNKKYP